MEDITTAVANLGFPIAVSIYLLIRIEGKLEALTESINELSRALIRAPTPAPETKKSQII